MRAEERRPAGIAKTDPARKLPRGPRLIDDSIQSGSLDPAPPVPLRGRRDFAAGPELREPVTHENHGQSACSARLEGIDSREPCRADAADGLGEECEADIRDSRIRCMEHVLSRRIAPQGWRAGWDRWVGNLFDHWTPGRGVERVRAQADKRLDEGRKRQPARQWVPTAFLTAGHCTGPSSFAPHPRPKSAPSGALRRSSSE